jgi:hypothetical protein
MSTPPLNPISLRYPFELKNQPDEVVQAHRYAFQGLVDLNQAVASLKSQINTHTTQINSIASTPSSGGTIIINSSNFPGLGGINDQTGATTYTVAATDNGILLVLNDASPVAVSLNSALTTPFFFFVTNTGAGLVTFTPTTGSIVGPTTLPKGYIAVIVFNGTNWYMSGEVVVPQTAGPTAHQWLASYNATTGVFTLSQPSFGDISGNLATSQLPTGLFSGTITTAQLTVGGTQGSMTFLNGSLQSQVPAT